MFSAESLRGRRLLLGKESARTGHPTDLKAHPAEMLMLEVWAWEEEEAWGASPGAANRQFAAVPVGAPS